ncbi:unnamed protein product, partial [Prorocentrum cordatum]
ALRSAIAALVPEWGQIGIASPAKYLGSEVRPGRGTLSWGAPLKKFRDRAELWRSIGAGLYLTAVAYRVYFLSVLLFVACVLLRLAPRPGNWISAPALQSLMELGFTFTFASLVSCATVAAAWTYQYENRHGGCLRVQEWAQQLLDRLHGSDNVTFQMAAWIRSCSLLRLQEAAGAVATAARARGTAPCLMDTNPMDDAERKTWQRRAVTLLRCLLGCNRGEGSIEHYACCELYHSFCSRHAGLALPAPGDRLACFLNFGQSRRFQQGEDTAEQATLLRTLTVYAVYRAHGDARCGSLRVGAVVSALLALLREGARGHSALESLLRSIQRRPLVS